MLNANVGENFKNTGVKGSLKCSCKQQGQARGGRGSLFVVPQTTIEAQNN